VFYETTELADPVQAPAVLRRGFQLLDDLICG